MGFMPDINVQEWANMCPYCGSKIKKPDCSEANCKDHEDFANWHCHNKKTGLFIAPITDCEEHWAICSDNCHDECACQDH